MVDAQHRSRLAVLRAKLDLAATRDPQRRTFGASGHGWAMQPVLSEADVAAFEAHHQVTLPDEYRAFLMGVSSAGAGPGYGLLPIEAFADELGPVPPAFLSEPFPYAETHPSPDEELSDDAWVWEGRGAIRMSHCGCGHYDILVVSGPERGHVWQDARASDGGLIKLRNSHGEPLSFFDWFETWLDACLSRAA